MPLLNKVNKKKFKKKLTQLVVLYLRSLIGIDCGGTTGKNMKIPNLSIQQLLEAGVHLGHKTLRWNPKMKKYIFGKRDSVHIIDLTQTLELTNKALEKIYEVISNNGKILFISTKKQASESIAELAKSQGNIL